jgi:UDP-N-acetylmuramate dehydrogenase
VVADAGVLYPVLANTTAGRGLAGLEFATGIPGTVGGAVYMNAGAYGSETTEGPRLGRRIQGSGRSSGWRTETSTLLPSQRPAREPWLGRPAGRLHLGPGDPEELKARIKEFRMQRMTGSPNRPSCGSTFKRPPGDFPGRVIEAAGLKGTRIGQIEVSPVHANYLVNLGGGTAEEALELIEFVREKVRERLESNWNPR